MNKIKKHTFVNTSFGVNKIMEVDSSMIKVEITDAFIGVSKEELKETCANAIDMAFEQLNANSFLIGLATGGRDLSIKFYPRVVDGKLELILGQYGGRRTGITAATIVADNLVVKTHLNARVEYEYVDDYGDGETYRFATYYVNPSSSSYFADASEEEQFAIETQSGYYSE